MTNFISLKNINRLLACLVVLVGLYILASPWFPWLAYQRDVSTKQPTIIAETENAKATRSGNYLLIPSAVIDSPILEGINEYTVNNGPWRRPYTSTPDKGSNTVIVGHRFTYSPSVKDSFYNLDKVDIGDDIVVYWRGARYHYVVSEVKTVEPTAVEIEAPTTDSRLTLYTCTPLWSSSQRLVVTALLQGDKS